MYFKNLLTKHVMHLLFFGTLGFEYFKNLLTKHIVCLLFHDIGTTGFFCTLFGCHAVFFV